MTAAELLAQYGIKLDSYAPGRHYTRCPKCSDGRSTKEHRAAKCLGVTIESDGKVHFGCNHCEWTGPEKGGGKQQGGEKRKRGDKWTTLAEHIYRDKDDQPFLLVRKCLDQDGNRQYPQFHWDGKAWVKDKPKVNGKPAPKIPYRLPQLIAAPVTATVYFCEGEKDADNLAKLGFVATTASEGASAKWDAALTDYFKDRHVVILPDADTPGRKHGQKVAKAINGVAASVRVVDLYTERSDGSDVSDWIADDTAGAKLARLAKEVPLWEPPGDDDKPRGDGGASADEDAEFARLAKLSLPQYERERKGAADRLGMRASILDKLVAAEREKLSGDEKPPALYEHWNVGPANEPVDGGILLRALKEAVQRYVFMTVEQAVAVVLWIVFSWLHEHEGVVTHSPILFVTSVEKESGKTTLLGVLNFLTRRSLQSVDISGPALFRSITKWEPTFIVDEADKAFVNNDDLRSVVNSGWTRGQGVVRCHPETHEPQVFSSFAPKVVGMKGRDVEDTTLSRSIIIEMRPKRANDPKEHVADFDHLDNETFARLRSQLMRWAADNAEALAKAAPEIPPGFHNRRRANWRTLLAVAEAGGGEWKKEGWKAALAIEAIAATFDPSIGVQLLAAIKGAFEARGTDRITSAGLVQDLVADETAPWATYNKGKPISQRQVANLLSGYGIKPRVIKLKDGDTARGYLLEWFADAFSRLHTSSDAAPSSPSVTSVTDLFSQDISRFSSVTGENEVTDKKDGKPFDNNEVTEVTDRNGGPATNAAWEALRSACEQSDAIAAERWGSDKHERYSDDYHGPPVEVPEQPPDPLDEHGEPVAEHQPKITSGLGESRRRELTASCRRWEADVDLDPADLEDALRNTVREEIATPHDEAAVEAEVQIILAMVRDAE